MICNRLLSFALGVLLLYGVARGAGLNEPPSDIVLTPGTYPAQWVVPDPDGDLGYAPHLEAELRDRTRLSIIGVPDFTTQSPLFGWVYSEQNRSPAQTRIIFALDESKGTGTGYDSIFLDTDQNQDLGDESRAMGQVGDTRWPGVSILSFRPAGNIPANTLFQGSDNAESAALWVSFSLENGKLKQGEAALLGCWAGEITTNKGEIPFRIADTNRNGKYGDQWSVSAEGEKEQGDAVLFDWGRSGQFPEPYPVERGPRYSVSVATNVAGRLYALEPSPSGDFLKVSAYTGPTARVALRVSNVGQFPSKAGVAVLVGTQGVYHLPPDGTLLDVPTGDYRLDRVKLEGKDTEGKTWNIGCSGGRTWHVGPDGEVVISIGGSVELAIAPESPSLMFSRGDRSRFPVKVLLSEGGEVLSWNSGRRSDGPAVVLRDMSGRVVLQAARAGLGWGGSRQYSMLVPKDLGPGEYVVEATFDAGPFGGILKESRIAVVD